MISFIIFLMVSFSLAFLVADARIFGCDTTSFNEDPKDYGYINSVGIFKIRPFFLYRFDFFRELLSCYYCLGVWVGPIAHLLMYYTFGERYWFYHDPSTQSWILGYLITSLTSSSGCYLLNALAVLLETSSETAASD